MAVNVDADAPFGGGDYLLAEKSSGQIILPVIILQVEAAPGAARGMNARGKGMKVVGKKRQSILIRMLPEHIRDRRVERCLAIRYG